MNPIDTSSSFLVLLCVVTVGLAIIAEELRKIRKILEAE